MCNRFSLFYIDLLTEFPNKPQVLIFTKAILKYFDWLKKNRTIFFNQSQSVIQ